MTRRAARARRRAPPTSIIPTARSPRPSHSKVARLLTPVVANLVSDVVSATAVGLVVAADPSDGVDGATTPAGADPFGDPVPAVEVPAVSEEMTPPPAPFVPDAGSVLGLGTAGVALGVVDGVVVVVGPLAAGPLGSGLGPHGRGDRRGGRCRSDWSLWRPR